MVDRENRLLDDSWGSNLTPPDADARACNNACEGPFPTPPVQRSPTKLIQSSTGQAWSMHRGHF
jgi:hypothetical protein